jgi:hypothetical protein
MELAALAETGPVKNSPAPAMAAAMAMENFKLRCIKTPFLEMSGHAGLRLRRRGLMPLIHADCRPVPWLSVRLPLYLRSNFHFVNSSFTVCSVKIGR